MKTSTHKKSPLALSIIAISIAAALGLSACQEEGPAEKAGKKIDNEAEHAAQTIGEMTDTAKQKLEVAKDNLEQKADSAKAHIDESSDASKGALERAGQKLDAAAKNAGQKIGEAAKSAGKELDGAVEKAKTAGDYIDNSLVITMAVKASLLKDSLLSASQIDVSTVNGVVTLTGVVDSEQSASRAVAIAGNQAHVQAVENKLLIKTLTPAR
ncbi:MAG: BON domain-containing protein [Methylococcales bacterium]|nr:BON domain-containing protein [Methylococcales bacterium]